MARYYGSEALRNKKLQDKVDDYVVEKGKIYAKKAVSAGMEDLSTKIRPKKANKTNREDLGDPDPYILTLQSCGLHKKILSRCSLDCRSRENQDTEDKRLDSKRKGYINSNLTS